MQLSQIPTRIAVPWASAGGKNIIPVDSQVNVNPGAASWTDGFPPATRTPLVAGGKAPDGLDVNGALNSLSAWARWVAAGNPTTFDAAFANAISGYPVGAKIIGQNNSLWISKTDGNFVDPTTLVGVPENQRSWAQVAFYSDIQNVINGNNLDSKYVKQGGVPGFPTNDDIHLGWDGAKLVYSIDGGIRIDHLIDTYALARFSSNYFVIGGPNSGNFTVPANVYQLAVTVVGGGGGGAGSAWPNPPSGLLHITGGGGGAGGYVEFVVPVAPGQTLSYVVGGGGAGGAANGNGSVGGTTIFASVAVAYGGAGGALQGGSGGTTVLNAFTGAMTQGGAGGDGFYYSSSAPTDLTAPAAGNGGASFFGGGGSGTVTSNPTGAATALGAGGGGSKDWTPNTGFNGGTGALIIRY